MTALRGNALLRFLGVQLVIGVAVGWAILALLIVLNVAGLQDLIFSAREGAVAIFMLMIVFAVTFGSLSIGTGVTLLARGHAQDEKAFSKGGRGGGGPEPHTAQGLHDETRQNGKA